MPWDALLMNTRRLTHDVYIHSVAVSLLHDTQQQMHDSSIIKRYIATVQHQRPLVTLDPGVRRSIICKQSREEAI